MEKEKIVQPLLKDQQEFINQDQIIKAEDQSSQKDEQQHHILNIDIQSEHQQEDPTNYLPKELNIKALTVANYNDPDSDEVEQDDYNEVVEDLSETDNKPPKYLKFKPKSIFNQSTQVMLSTGFNFDADVLIGFDEEEILIQNSLSSLKKLTAKDPLFKYLGISIDKTKIPIYQQIPKFFCWIILFYCTLTGACMSPWILAIPADNYMRISWRYLIFSFVMIPFIMYEKRNGDENIKKKYKLSYIFKLENQKKIFLVAFAQSYWFTLVLFGFEWTWVTHSIMLGSCMNFFLSIKRTLFGVGQYHNIEYAGQILCGGGILACFLDSFFLNLSDLQPSNKNYIVTKYLRRTGWQRMCIGDFAAVSTSFMMTIFADINKDIKDYFPPYLTIYISSLYNVVLMQFSAYFFHGTDFSTQTFWGWFGLFSNKQFSGFFYMSIILAFGNFLSTMFIQKVYEPVVTGIAASFEPFLGVFMFPFTGVQHYPQGASCLGFGLILVGLVIIVLGQHLVQSEKKHQFQEEQEDKLIKDHIRKSVRKSIRQSIRQSVKQVEYNNKESEPYAKKNQ